MTRERSSKESTAAQIRKAVFTLVAKGHLSAVEAKPLLDKFQDKPLPQPIAVIGMAGRFGDRKDLNAYWRMIESGQHCIRPIPKARWSDGGDAVGGFLEDPSLFDPLFFKIAPSEAGLMDPQQRLFLETAWFALEDAALSERDLAGSGCGVFVGVGAGDYGRRLEALGVGEAPLALMGNVPSILAARIAYFLDLKGPALAVDTACSSSLVAVHLACESLRRDECEMAIAGGVCVINSGRFIKAMSQAGMISASGRCHSFDSRADGFVCGEGAGAVILKRLDKALADGDVIHGVILADGMNQDGRTNGITAPSAPSQEALERKIYRDFGIEPSDIGYIETHGTGTPLGDPIEVEALNRVFKDQLAEGFKIPLGSVKTHIGHALTAAGIAGLLKTLLMMRKGVIPPNADFKSPNPRLALHETPFRIAAKAEPWHPAASGRRMAAVSSFGFSGTNAHLVLAEAPLRDRAPFDTRGYPVLLSARDADSLALRASDLAQHLKDNPKLRLDDLAWTLAFGKNFWPTPHPSPLPEGEGDLRHSLRDFNRQAFEAHDLDEAIRGFERIAEGKNLGLSSEKIRSWIAGENLDWRDEFKGLKPLKIALPAHPLNRVSCEPLIKIEPQSNAQKARGDFNRPGRINSPLQEMRLGDNHFDEALLADGKAFAKVEAWGRQAACRAMIDAGLFKEPKKAIMRAALARSFGVSSKRLGLFDAILLIMERSGLLKIEGDLLRLGDPAGFIDESYLKAEFLSLQSPESSAFLNLLQQTTQALPGVLRGEIEGSAVLFPEGRLDCVSAIYKGNRLADHFNRLMAQSVADRVGLLLDAGANRISILEIGAGTGGASASILEALKPFKAKLRYVYTDVSLGFLKHGRDAFGDSIELALFDATREGEAQGFETASFDMAVASNVLHAVPDLAETLGHIGRLLKPKGLLALNEVTAVQDFATLSFGLTEGWWAFKDKQRRLPGAPLADVAGWRAVLAESGFPRLDVLSLDEKPEVQAILLAERDGRIADPRPVGKLVSLPHPSPLPEARVPGSQAGAWEPEAAPAWAADASEIEAAIREEASQTLGLSASSIDPLARFMDYGLDSILGLDLVNRLNRLYGLNLAPTIVFEKPTLRDLANHLIEIKPISRRGEFIRPGRLKPPLPLEARLQDEPIAVIGMAGRFADADGLEAFHDMLAEGRSGITSAQDRLGIDPDNPPDHLKSTAPYLRFGGLLKHIDGFDPMFFRISGREAELTDPQHRIFLTEVWRALEDAGYAGDSLAGADCGIYVGCYGGDYTHLMAEKNIVPDAFAFTGNAASILASRIAYILDLKGPALAVDTACSSSLVAVHLACQAIRAGECDMAIAGGVFINTTVGFNTAAASAGMLSPRGRCAAFDADADGFVPGEGSGAVILKPLSRALAEGDCVIAVIAGSATNQDGKTNGITAPNASSQAMLIGKAQKRAGIKPHQVNMIETHGTGTRLGDPIEIEGLVKSFADAPLGSCWIGSVKTNVGHAAHAAGIAGLIKVLLSFRHDELYPSLHFNTPNPAIHLDKTPFAVNTELRAWPKPAEGLRVAGVSSFGFSGTNCHIVLTDPEMRGDFNRHGASAAPDNESACAGRFPHPGPLPEGEGDSECSLRDFHGNPSGRMNSPQHVLIALSARSPKALAQRRLDLALWLKRHPNPSLIDLAFTLGVGRNHFEYRWASAVQDIDALSFALDHPEAQSASSPLDQAMALYLSGGLPDFKALNPGGMRMPLPTYPFEERSYWLTETEALKPVVVASEPMPDLLEPVWEVKPWSGTNKLGRVGLLGDAFKVSQAVEAFKASGIETSLVRFPHPGPLPGGEGRASGSQAPAWEPGAAWEPDAPVLFFFSSESSDWLPDFFDCLRSLLPLTERKITLIHVHDGSPLAAATIAAGPSLRFIAEHIRLRSVALTGSMEHLIREASEVEPEVSIDSEGVRRVRSLKPVVLEADRALHNGGVWLITGGLGGLGPHLAKHLSLTRGARIALLGRSSLAGEKSIQLAALRSEGVQVHYVQADIADVQALNQAIAEIEGLLGPIEHVLHAAGVPSLLGLAESSWKDMARTFRSKIEGTLALDRAFEHKPLKRFVLFSSIAAELGDFGQCDYAVANAYLGRFAEWRNLQVEKGERQGKTLSIAWPIWEGGHAALGPEGSSLVNKALGIKTLSRGIGMAVLDRALASSQTPSALFLMNQDASKPELEARLPASSELNAVKVELSGLISRLLKINPAELKSSANLGDFGFDSIALKEFAQVLSKRYQIAISPAVFFAHSSIDALAVYLCETYSDALFGELPKISEPVVSIKPKPDIKPEGHGAVAIIGLSGRFPGGSDLESFWKLIESGGISVSSMPESRMKLLGLSESSARAGFIEDIELFDPAFFQISRRDAIHMDPQHRLALTAAWQALEDAGIAPGSLAGQPVGVFLGQQVSGYAALLREAPLEVMAQAALGNVNALMPNRISHSLDLRGPSESIDTACSSGLVAVHRAIKALRNGECELALAGASSLLLNLDDLSSTQSLGILSADGLCHSFDARANGYVKGEGIGLLVLKPLERALADGDAIHAVIRGSAVNHGGKAQSLTAPNPNAQRDLIRQALLDAGVAMQSIAYIEAHGTGTELGDPIEVEALKQVFAGAPENSIALGAIKANIGHLEPASGVAGLFKLILALQNKTLPPLAGLQTVNPLIELEHSPFYLPRQSMPWPEPSEGEPRRAGLSSFGFGGTNAHLILEEAPSVGLEKADRPALLLLSAPETALLAPYAQNLARHLDQERSQALQDVAHSLMRGRTPLMARAAVPIKDRDSAIWALNALAQHIEEGQPKPAGMYVGLVDENNPLAFLGEEPEDRDFFMRLASAGRFERLARLWVGGIAIDWPQISSVLPEAQCGQIAHIPSVPMRQQRCWVELNAKMAPVQKIAAPLVSMPLPVQAPVSMTLPVQAPVSMPVQPGQDAIEKIRDIIAQALYISVDELDDQARFMDLGLDSILAVEVTASINRAFDIQIQATRLYDYPTVSDLALFVQASSGVAPIPLQAPVQPTVLKPAPSVSIVESIRQIIAQALYISAEELDDHTGFADLGLDSILAVEVADKLNQAFKCELQATRLYDYPNVKALASYIEDRLPGFPHLEGDAGSQAGAASGSQAPAWEPALEAREPILEFLLNRLSRESGEAVLPNTPLDRLSIQPERAALILAEIGERFACRIDAAEVGACRDLAAVASLIRKKLATPHPSPLPEGEGDLSHSSDFQEDKGEGQLALMRKALAGLLYVSEDSIETHVPLSELSLDLVLAQAFAEHLVNILGQNAPDARQLMQASSLEALAETSKPDQKLSSLEALALPLKVQSIEASPKVEVAVVGMACRYPGAKDKDSFWDLLREGRSGISRVPLERWNPKDHVAGLSKPEQRSAVEWGGFIDGIDRFDPLFFNLSPREAELMDPQQRLFLEEAWHAFEDAGLSDKRLKGARCGLFIGAGQGDYSRHLPMDDPAQVTGQFLLGNAASILVSRIAYLLDLKGPAIALDTACSSALVAAEMGFKSILDGSCDMALVGGVNLMTSPQMHVMTAASGMLAPDGQCRTFDDQASGFVPGEGIGLLLLKRFDHALADRDRIYGVFAGAGTNQDGKTSGITAPNSNSQESLELEVWKRFDIDPADFGLIEAHGTATQLGDPIEVDALSRAFARHCSRHQDCPIGSVKTNIGHTLASAGAAGLIKALLSLHHGVIPPSLNFKHPNRHIDFEKTPFFVPTQALPWQERKLAAVSSFGFSGTNAHIILKEAPEQVHASVSLPKQTLCLITARDAQGLMRQAQTLLSFIQAKRPELSDVAHSLALRRSHLEQRLAVYAADLDDLLNGLSAFIEGEFNSNLIGPAKRKRSSSEIRLETMSPDSPYGLKEIGRSWLEGSEIPESLFENGRFIDLPGTSFASIRCWIEAKPHAPIKHEALTLSLTANMPIMVNHRVKGQAVLPGMASLVLFHKEALKQGFSGALKDIVWRQPIKAPSGLSFDCSEQEDGLLLQLRDENLRVLASAKALRQAKAQPMAVDLSLIAGDCKKSVAPDAVYRKLEAKGIVHGEGFRLLDSIQVSEGQVLARLKSADALACDPIQVEGLSPAVIDSALQALAALESSGSSDKTLLPAGVASFYFYESLDEAVFAWLTVDRSLSDASRLLADLRLLNARGEILAELMGFEARALPQPSLKPAPVLSKGPGELFVLRPAWMPDALPQNPVLASPLVLHGTPEREWALSLVREYGGEAFRIGAFTEEGLFELIENLPAERPLIFAAWREKNAPALDTPALVFSERRGVHALHTVFKALAKRGGMARILLVTRGLQSVLPNDGIDPAFGALPGFARSAARELPQIELSCIDLSFEDQSLEMDKKQREWLLRERSNELVAYRQNMRLIQRMARVSPEWAPKQALPHAPVCLILGGAGGLGHATSRRLAEKFSARIAWVGRRVQDDAIEAHLAEIYEAGGQAVYMQADIVKPADLKQVIEAVQRRWGHIHLAVHSAIVLRDKPVETMASEDLDAVLSPKSYGLMNLIELLADDPPEMICLHSSANGFTVNPGQANYAGACTFVDALALSLIGRFKGEVRVLDWGIWGETGIVSDERFLKRALQAGIVPLETLEGLDLFEWALNCPLNQAILMKALGDTAEQIQADLCESVRFNPQTARLDLDAGEQSLRSAFLTVSKAELNVQASEMSALIQYGRERLFRIYAELGLNHQGPASFSSIAQALGIIPERLDLFRAHLDLLARCGWLKLSAETDPMVQLLGVLPSHPVAKPMIDSAASRLLDIALDGAIDVLKGLRPATDVLFPGGRNDWVEAVYKDDRSADLYNKALSDAVVALSQGHPLRVLEIGAGTGSATAAIVQALDVHAPGSHYFYTDVSRHFVSLGEARYGSRPDTHFQTLDIGLHPAEQGIDCGSFDLVIAANVLHALPSILKTLAHVKALLKNQGVALLLEATARSDFATFIFGLTDGWWAFKDSERRLPHSPLLSVEGWRLAMASQGLRLQGLAQMSEAQSILMTASDGWLPEAFKAPRIERVQAVQMNADTPWALEKAKAIICQVLRLKPGDLDPDEPLERYGVDSLVINDIHARLEAEFGKFSKTLVFEAVSLRALAERLSPMTEAKPLLPKALPAIQAPNRSEKQDGVAIIGMAGKFPGAENIIDFWNNLENAQGAIGDMPLERRALWPGETLYPGGYLNDVAGFDALFFNISPNEAALMDPQERLFLETAWSSLEDAGRQPAAWEGDVGVFVGAMGRDYLRLSAETRGMGDAPAWSIANRVSHVLNLKGPSMAVDTACSSALTALHLASESLRSGDCRAALAGSVHLILHPASREGLKALGMLSESGNARPFSSDADGLVGGEGVCCFVLRRLEDAIKEGDRILGVIKATGLSANGRARNYMAPSIEAQADSLSRFLNQKRIDYLDYVECQAVGSLMGDAIEVAGLAKALSSMNPTIAIGSLEGSIGHLEAASGSAQIVKVLGMLNRQRILPTLGVTRLSEDVLEALTNRFEISRVSKDWPISERPHRALVQSFGAGGGGAFAVIEASDVPIRSVEDKGFQVIPVSAASAQALYRMAQALSIQPLDVALSSIAWTLQTGRIHLNHRLALIASDVVGLKRALNDFLQGKAGAWHKGMRQGEAGNGKGPASYEPEAIAAYWAKGHSFDWSVLYPGHETPTPVSLPTYAFEHKPCWIKPIEAPVIQAIPEFRHRVAIEGPSEPEDLSLQMDALKWPEAGEILIEVKSCGLNFADLLCVRGLHPNLKSYPYLPGFEVSGIVLAVGQGVQRLQPGQAVMALSGGRGGLASHVTVPEHWAVAMPQHLDFDQAAATPIGYLTMAHALEKAALKAGETILIQSAAGGTGPFAVQMALAKGAHVIATAGSAAKLAALKDMGVDHAINYLEDDFSQKALEYTQGRGVDVVLNTLGGDAIQKGIDLLAPGGRYCEIALAGLCASGPIDLSKMTENQSLITINLGRMLSEPEASRQALNGLASHFESARIKPLIYKTFGMDRLQEAFHCMDTRENIGKIIVNPGSASGSQAGAWEPGAWEPGRLSPLPKEEGVKDYQASELEPELRKIAAEILGLQDAELDASRPLEDYGLNSVSAVALMRKVHGRLGIAVPVNVLYEAKTLSGLVSRLGVDDAKPKAVSHNVPQILIRDKAQAYEPMVPIQGGLGRASIWVHGAPGDASWVSRLAEVLNSDEPIYGIEARGVSGAEAPRKRVATMARDYVEALQRIQPEGPYRLGGYSGGGIIAYEMAQQLIASGSKVEKLVLLDAYAPGNSALTGMGHVYRQGFIYQLSVNWFGSRWNLKQPLSASQLEGFDKKAQLNIALDHLYAHANPDIERERLSAYLQGMERVGQSIGKAIETYEAKPLNAEIDALLIRCTQGMSGPDNRHHLPIFLLEGDYTEGWQALLQKPLIVKSIECDHFSLLDDPWRKQVAEAIQTFFSSQPAPTDLRQQVRQVVEDEVRRVLPDLPNGIPPHASLADLGAHSIDRAEVATSAMERLELSIPLSALVKVNDINGLIDLLTHSAMQQDENRSNGGYAAT